MESLRKILAFSLVIALASYGMLTGALAHSHEYSRSHQVHFLDDGNAHHDYRDPHYQHGPEGNDQNAPEHSKSGFHSHSSTHFGPNDSVTLKITFSTMSLNRWCDPSGPNTLEKDEPPFKPPRTIL